MIADPDAATRITRAQMRPGQIVQHVSTRSFTRPSQKARKIARHTHTAVCYISAAMEAVQEAMTRPARVVTIDGEPVNVTWGNARSRDTRERLLTRWGIPNQLIPLDHLEGFAHTNRGHVFTLPDLATTGAFIAKQTDPMVLYNVAWVAIHGQVPLSTACELVVACMGRDTRREHHPRLWAHDWAALWVLIVNLWEARRGAETHVAELLHWSLREFNLAQLEAAELEARRWRAKAQRRVS